MDDQDQTKAGLGQQQSAILGSVQKEQGPAVLISEQPLTASEQSPDLHPEVKEAGVETVSQQPKLMEEAQKAGLTWAKESVPVATDPSGIVQFEYLKSSSGGYQNSALWLYKLAEKVKKVRKLFQANIGI